MQIPVVGMDPSLRNWGLAEALLDLETGELSTPNLSLIQTGDEPKGKQVRQNSIDIMSAETLMTGVYPVAQKAKVIFVETPVGSQSAPAMKGYGVCVGLIGALRSLGIPVVEVYEAESKTLFAGKRTATKDQMIAKALELYPDANWPRYKEKGQMVISAAKAEHMADAIAAIHSGVRTPLFQQLMRLYA
jgi:hypothetical protein